ncbi:universal stress protein [Psychromicrobium xiongbiense]|uniref:universal stress protein n=1 Tax=Psychromicrobium xiongbiense TaxID=3051184 RepID=UPI002556F655|nr:universal stress protein [Psychromicrobium sp. YIM S02556]
MRYVVGYAPKNSAQDAMALAAAIAGTQGASLDIVYVTDDDVPYVALNPQGNRVSASEQEVLTAERVALDAVPAGIDARFHVRESESVAQGLIEAAAEFDAGLMVVGATRAGLLGRFALGPVADALLHASPLPVALAPASYRGSAISRLTSFVGTREGAQAAIDVAIRAAGRRGLPLRFVSLVELDQLTQQDFDLDSPLSPARQHVNSVLAGAAARLPAGEATATIAHGQSIEEAIESIGWEPGELALIGSSRLAQKNRLFLGNTAHKVLRALPVPLVVVPRDFDQPDVLD